MAAATEWLNALAAGASVVSVRRREPERRPLNLPRELFTRRGLAAYHGLPPDERTGFLRCHSAPSYPPGRRWDEPLERARRDGRFRVAPQLNGARQIICATGFKRGFGSDTLLRRLVSDHGLETADHWIVLTPDSTVPALTDADSNAGPGRRAGSVVVPGCRHPHGREVRRPTLPTEGPGMAYTLRGRLESTARGRARSPSRGVRGRAGAQSLVAGRARGPHARRRTGARPDALSQTHRLSARVGCASARPPRARSGHGSWGAF